MPLPKLVEYNTEAEYKAHYLSHYCNQNPIMTHDNIPVMFYPETFEHSFYKRSAKKWSAKKDIFSKERGERIDWIKHVLQDPTVMMKKGYDKARNNYDSTRRVTYMNQENFVVVIWVNDKKGTAKFVTAYLVDNPYAAEKIRNSPDWGKMSIKKPLVIWPSS
jgi:hypothetical protein